MELYEQFKAEGVPLSYLIEESAEVRELATLVVGFAGGVGGMAGLAAVLNAFFRRHQNKSVLMERDGTRVEVKGMSPQQMSGMIDRVLDKAAADQREADRLSRDLDLPSFDDGTQ
jgi:hypothetical protein